MVNFPMSFGFVDITVKQLPAKTTYERSQTRLAPYVRHKNVYKLWWDWENSTNILKYL